MKSTIDMARKAGIDAEKDTLCQYEGWLEPLKAFEALVRADERDRAMRENAYVQAEREACAKVCESIASDGYPTIEHQECADAIRARSQK
jgi:hypothetical protein